ncbi:hypothetical protein PILCRDRAFT_814754 [Piloderma croceum F 1598]|uniref:Uncharacterized protein n=1 Tax=Piloderma croceum (strain F 1598) TaxID=765440 RepID=A0A0C3BNN0_PILCF|nr:hypothetical protein PILCRDRAFT_814754 [Piloderma croceum F 1598]
MRMVLKRLPTASPIPNDHNRPPKHAFSLLGSRQAYNRLITISNLGRKAKIDVGIRNHVGEGLAAVVIEVANECFSVSSPSPAASPPSSDGDVTLAGITTTGLGVTGHA